jgi:hypothetical protein
MDESLTRRVRQSLQARLHRHLWLVVSLGGAVVGIIVIRLVNKVVNDALYKNVGKPIIDALARLISEPLGLSGLFVLAAIVAANVLLFGAAVLDNLSWVVRRREKRGGVRPLTREERDTINNLREKWSIPVHNAVVNIINGLSRFADSHKFEPVGALFRFPRDRLNGSHAALFAVLENKKSRLPPAEVKALLQTLLRDYMDGVRWFHAACEVVFADEINDEWYKDYHAKWIANHQVLVAQLSALAGRDDWPELTMDMNRAQCWTHRFDARPDGTLRVRQ